MFVVIFEMEPEKESAQEYFDLAAELQPELGKIDGFISVERFSSMYNEGKYLSVSFWRDDKALNQWREHLGHKDAQKKGLNEIFRNYRIRVAEVIRDYGKDDRKETP